jgi:threonine synthase
MSIFTRYADRLPHVAPEFRCTLGEGSTPLLASRAIGPALGLDHLYFKCEHQNPTGSYKDRFLALELSLLRQSGATFVCGTSSGNTGSSLAAYAARYAMPCYLFVCEKTPSGKLLQMRAHGAHVFRVRDFCLSREVSTQVMNALQRIAMRNGTRATISAFHFAPEGMQGVQTISYEIADQLEVLGQQAAHVFTPGGGCGLFLAIARGFLDLAQSTRCHIVQPRLNDTVISALREGGNEARESQTTTSLSGLAVPQVIDGNDAIAAARRTNGNGFLIEDEDARFWQRELLQKEGVWVEPASAVSVAGLAQAVREGVLRREEPVVCVLTGHGFKDPVSAETACAEEHPMIAADDMERVLAT